MPLDLDEIAQRRNKFEWGVTVAIVLAIVLSMPSPEVEIVNGERVAVLTAFGWKLPKWAQIAGIVVILILIQQIVARVGRAIWPVKIEAEEIHRSDEHGMTIAWIPDEPGTPSPMHYEPWVGTAETTAEDFLNAQEPNPMRAMLVRDAWHAEYREFHTALRAWLKDAPETTLRDLMPAAEAMTQGGHARWVEHVLQRLKQAYQVRGIPSGTEIEALIERRRSEGIAFTFSGLDDEEDEDGPVFLPWTGTSETTAEEFLKAEGPEQLRGGYWGSEEEDREDLAFDAKLEAWLATAPEATLRDLVPTYEQIATGMNKSTKKLYLYRLQLAEEARGIPSQAEIDRLEAETREPAESIVEEQGWI